MAFNRAFAISMLAVMTAGCTEQRVVDADLKYQEQMRRTDGQLDRTDRAYERQEQQADRWDKLLQRWEDQADLYDKILEKQLKQLDSKP